MDFEQTILSTLLKYNDIFDAFQKLFNLHNYNCAEQRQKLQSFLTTKKQNDCIYITLNKESDVIPFQEDFERQEKKFIQLVQDDRVYLESKFDHLKKEKSINLIKDENKQQYSQQEQELTQHLTEISETYSTKLESRQMKSIFEERLLQYNQQLEYLQAKFALKQQTEQSFADIENSISNMSQTMHYQRQDILKIGKQLNQLSIKQNQNYNEQTESITKLNEQLKRLDFTESQINQLDQSILTMHQEKMSNSHLNSNLQPNYSKSWMPTQQIQLDLKFIKQQKQLMTIFIVLKINSSHFKIRLQVIRKLLKSNLCTLALSSSNVKINLISMKMKWKVLENLLKKHNRYQNILNKYIKMKILEKWHKNQQKYNSLIEDQLNIIENYSIILGKQWKLSKTFVKHLKSHLLIKRKI